MIRPRTVVISPSGNFYGSEQVLVDFLRETKASYRVFVPASGRLLSKLPSDKKHIIEKYSSVKALYARILFLLLFGNIKSVYCNEGAHIRYIKVLALIFRTKRFAIHIRILEDAQQSRLGNVPKNVVLIAISEFVASFLKDYNDGRLRTFYDPYIPAGKCVAMPKVSHNPIRAGIIGRISRSKGLAEIEAFCDYVDQKGVPGIELHLIGDVNESDENVSRLRARAHRNPTIKIIFHGFIGDTEKIYSSIDVVIHFSKVEPLGRIFFESLDYGRPIIGFNCGGIGELAKQMSLNDCMIDSRSDWEQILVDRLMNINGSISKYEMARQAVAAKFSAEKYCRSLEEIILK